ncbi:MAG: prepilin-type N-terminal cleavage/methylation domain-containing protein [Campylobacterales bacterium]|nr:prepilin-type N-terminal cleavage/methylation domain-containing protein [Campylobacterales bacterium]
MKNAFTMIEMIFVIVVLGILAAIAVPKFAATRTDAEITKGRADISAIRSAIITERQARLIVGSNSYIPIGTGTYTVNGATYKQIDNGGLFGGLLMYPITSSATNGHWSSSASGTYIFKVLNTDNTFTYNPADGTFTCVGTYCSNLVD